LSALPLAVMLQLIGACAPTVAPSTMASVLRTESGFDPNLLHVNGAGGGDLHPANKSDAVVQAIDLIVVQRKSVDLGLGQLNAANLPALGLSVADAFDPCKNLAAAATLLSDGYTAAAQAQPDPQRALRIALSRYNTGDPSRGFANGYVGKVERSAQYVVPAIVVDGVTTPTPQGSMAVVQPVQSKTLPPSWDAFAMASLHPASAFAASGSAAPPTIAAGSPSGGPAVFPASPAADANPASAGQALAAIGAATRAGAPVVLHAVN
jgi:type IV secretion system protein VirB1